MPGASRPADATLVAEGFVLVRQIGRKDAGSWHTYLAKTPGSHPPRATSLRPAEGARPSGELCVVKSKLCGSAGQAERVWKVLRRLRTLKHPNIILCSNVLISRQGVHVMLVLEHCTRGSLLDLILSEQELRRHAGSKGGTKSADQLVTFRMASVIITQICKGCGALAAYTPVM